MSQAFISDSERSGNAVPNQTIIEMVAAPIKKSNSVTREQDGKVVSPFQVEQSQRIANPRYPSNWSKVDFGCNPEAGTSCRHRRTQIYGSFQWVSNQNCIQMPLFAGAFVGLAQIVEGVDPEKTKATSHSWRALRVFLYGAIMLSLLGAFLSLIIIKMCSDLPIARYQRELKKSQAIADPQERPSIEPLSREEILIDAGISPSYFFVDTTSAWVLIFACLFGFISLAFWVAVSADSRVTAGFTLTIFILCGMIFIVTVRIAGRAQGWV
ncbi:hypothetical protein FRC19_008574 [Serendipita sp. 401]|nr:hypothetical protein FRC19_008574 [Serendipita sp. 401]